MPSKQKKNFETLPCKHYPKVLLQCFVWSDPVGMVTKGQLHEAVDNQQAPAVCVYSLCQHLVNL